MRHLLGHQLEGVMPIAYYVTHPQVKLDPAIPVSEWGLSEEGRKRAHALLNQFWITAIQRIVSSAERKAIETAEIIGKHIGVAVELRLRTQENDRSATGFLPPREFEQTADEFFRLPYRSVCGWERAVDAQVRIVTEVDNVLRTSGERNVLFVGHGGVGTLLLVSLLKIPISRQYDQPAGGGNYFSFHFPQRSVVHAWQPIDQYSNPSE
jgi:broad specificity phosphatase PhoE